jgi:hypothetical protein
VKLINDLLDIEEAQEESWGWGTYGDGCVSRSVVPPLKAVIDELDTRYFFISKARKELFRANNQAYEKTIDIQFTGCDELVNWTVDEPDILAFQNHEQDLWAQRYEQPDNLPAADGWAGDRWTASGWVNDGWAGDGGSWSHLPAPLHPPPTLMVAHNTER